ncbi:MAG: MarR family transcriptional regulator [Fulvimarina manganoxydans]|uniref:MarR family winged helix-turn-helix transcriptional regulator n=1 Tax=Fulvimarina manganoxydans TaxID=937218 RepID=UPI002355F737|nr:MarR family transcriptional regulator [Fulvimarina manganoxydans]MCK5931992.1 MarR family transcriptional regulator [Fulvimarina manganoxydans]
MDLSAKQHLVIRLFDAARMMRQGFEHVHRDQKLSWPQIRIIARLLAAEGIGQSELGALLEMEPMTISRQVDRLVDAGLVERRTEAGDRRVRRLFLTERSHAMRDWIRERSDLVLDLAFDGLSEGEKASLAKTLDLINGNLQRSSTRFEVQETLSPATARTASSR